MAKCLWVRDRGVGGGEAEQRERKMNLEKQEGGLCGQGSTLYLGLLREYGDYWS